MGKTLIPEGHIKDYKIEMKLLSDEDVRSQNRNQKVTFTWLPTIFVK